MIRAIALLLCLFCASCEEYQGLPRMSEVASYPKITIAGREIERMEPQAEALVPMRQQETPKTRKVWATVTAYCPCARCCGEMTGKTSTRTNAWRPGVAVDPRAIAYGSLVHVPGYERAEWAKADDTGAAMRRAWREHKKINVDIRYQYHWEAVQWGTQEMEITIRQP